MNSPSEMGGLSVAAGELCALAGNPATIRIKSKSMDTWAFLIKGCNRSVGVGESLQPAQIIQPAERA
jgi:hypothetical protein